MPASRVGAAPSLSCRRKYVLRSRERQRLGLPPERRELAGESAECPFRQLGKIVEHCVIRQGGSGSIAEACPRATRFKGCEPGGIVGPQIGPRFSTHKPP